MITSSYFCGKDNSSEHLSHYVDFVYNLCLAGDLLILFSFLASAPAVSLGARSPSSIHCCTTLLSRILLQSFNCWLNLFALAISLHLQKQLLLSVTRAGLKLFKCIAIENLHTHLIHISAQNIIGTPSHRIITLYNPGKNVMASLIVSLIAL